MAEPYEDLVKEYLEISQGVFVRQNLIFSNKRQELDILGVRLKPRMVLLAEVSATYPQPGKIEKMKKTLLSKQLAEFVRRETGFYPTRKMIFYWQNPNAKRQRNRIEEQTGESIKAVSLQEIAKWLRDKGTKGRILYSRSLPNTTTLQLL